MLRTCLEFFPLLMQLPNTIALSTRELYLVAIRPLLHTNQLQHSCSNENEEAESGSERSESSGLTFVFGSLYLQSARPWE